jgi:ABC-type sugar transport system permease subunit
MRQAIQSKRNIIILATPALLLLAFFVLYPLARIIIMSFQKNDGLSISQYIGFANYKKLLSDPAFVLIDKKSLWLCLLALIFNAVLAIFVSFILCGIDKRQQRWIRTVFILPMILSVSVISQLWLSIYHADWGLLNSFLTAIGLEKYRQQWLINPKTALNCVAVVGMWWFFGMDLLLAFSGIKAVPDSLFEAAELDGCTYFQTATHVVLPLCKNVCRTCFLISATGGFFTFPQVYIMTGGGPGDITMTIMMYMYKQAFSNQHYGLASAVAVLGIIQMIVILSAIFFLFKKIKGEE